ncbi:MAG: hypothetical protein HGB10_04885 [Coriobacteriia bacterium]|nr:hypothetical protein [Coriobacteriia bacterium]
MAAPLKKRLKRRMKKAVNEIGKHVPVVREIARRRDSARLAERYARTCAENPVTPGVAIFESYSGRSYACSPRALCEAMRTHESTRGYELIYALARPVVAALNERGGFDVRGLRANDTGDGVDLDALFSAEDLEALAAIRIVVRRSQEYFRDYARASLWVSNNRIPPHLIPREGQTYIQTWHGTPLKRLGFDIETKGWANPMFTKREWHEAYGLEGERFSYLLAASPFAAKALGSTFNLPKIGRTDAVIELGYPRNDYLSTFTAEQAAATRARMGIPEGNRVVLYAPTWREDQYSTSEGWTYEPAVDFERLLSDLGDGYTVLFRAHCLIASSFDFARYGDSVVDASKVTDINQLYAIADVLVTDYSSVFFDYSNLRRPVVFYMYDLDTYANDMHGFYLELDELPGPVVRTQPELTAALKAAENPSAAEVARVRAFAETYAPLDDGHASERVIERCVAPLVYHGSEPVTAPEKEVAE